MTWLVWMIVGAGLGWWTERVWASRPLGIALAVPGPATRREGVETNAILALLLATIGLVVATERIVRRQLPNNSGAAPPGAAAPPPDSARWWLARVALLLIVFSAIVSLAGALHFRPIDSHLYQIEAFLLSPRVSALGLGLAIGIWASRCRAGIAARAHEFYQALLGSEKTSSWALQSAVAILALLGIVLALKPDLLDHIESLKAGEVEAKFSNVSTVSTVTREAGRVTGSFFSSVVTIDQWLEFELNYGDGSPRDAAVKLFDGSAIGAQRKAVRDLLFEHYIEPLMRLLDCLDDTGNLAEITRSARFISMAEGLRTKILSANEADSELGTNFSTEAHWFDFIKPMNDQIERLSQIIENQIPDSPRKCTSYGLPPWSRQYAWTKRRWGRLSSILSIRYFFNHRMWAEDRMDDDAKELSLGAESAVEQLKKSKTERALKLSYIDPYVVGAVGDLLALARGPAEKATFLLLVKGGYPSRMNLIQPGLINLYYQIVDAENDSDAPWPFDEKIADLDHAMEGADFIIEHTRLRAADAGGNKEEVTVAAKGLPKNSSRWSRRYVPTVEPASPPSYNDILKVYFKNKFLFLTKYLDIYNRRALAGDPLGEQDKIRWMQFYRQTEGVLHLGGPGVTLTAPDFDSDALTEEDVPQWKTALGDLKDNVPGYLFDAHIAMALSSIMLTENSGHRASAQACAVARYYVARAREMLLSFADYDEAQKSKLRGYMLQVDARLDVSCQGY